MQEPVVLRLFEGRLAGNRAQERGEFRGGGKILEDLVRLAADERANLVGVALGVPAGDGGGAAFDMAVVEDPDDGPGREMAGQQGEPTPARSDCGSSTPLSIASVSGTIA